MWPLIKAEILYNKYLFIGMYLGIIILLLMFHQDIPPYEKVLNEMILFPSIIFTICLNYTNLSHFKHARDKSNRIRLFVLTPVSSRQVALTRMLTPFIFMAGSILLMFIYAGLTYFEITGKMIFFLISMGSLVLIINALFAIASDIEVVFDKQIKKWEIPIIKILIETVNLIAFVLALLIYYGFSNIMIVDDKRGTMGKVYDFLISPSILNAAFYLTLGFCMVLLSFKVFESRKSYVS